jgi:transcriptional regulator with XRE-family HTH domain
MECLNEEIGERIKQARKSMGISAEYIKSIAMVNVNTWYRWERAEVKISDNALQSVSNSFLKCGVKCSVEWLKTGSGEAPSNLDLKNISKPSDESEEIKIHLEVELFREHYPNSVIFMNTSSSMKPHFFSGDYVGGIIIHTRSIKSYSGRFCIVEFEVGKPLIRKFNMVGDRYVFTVINPSHHDISPNISTTPPKRFASILFHRGVKR